MTKEKVIELVKLWAEYHIAHECIYSTSSSDFKKFEESVNIELEEVLRYLNDH